MRSKIAQLEKAIEKKCVEYAIEQGWVEIKLDKSKRSWPDRLFVGPDNKHFFVEFKRPGEKPRPQQSHRIGKLVALGHHVVVLDSFDRFKKVFDYYR